jgi:hypothetical protein
LVEKIGNQSNDDFSCYSDTNPPSQRQGVSGSQDIGSWLLSVLYDGPDLPCNDPSIINKGRSFESNMRVTSVLSNVCSWAQTLLKLKVEAPVMGSKVEAKIGRRILKGQEGEMVS